MLVGGLGSPCPSRIHHHHLAAALTDRLETSWPVGCGGQAPVGLIRVGPEHEEIGGAVDIRNRDQIGVSEHETRRDVLRHLVDGGCAEDALGPEHLEKDPRVEDARHRMDVGIPQIDAHGIVPMLGDDGQKVGFDQSECLVPRRRLMPVAPLDQRNAYPVRVFVDLAQCRALGADEPVAENVVAVSPDPDDLLIRVGDLETAGRFTEWASPEVDRIGHLAATITSSARSRTIGRGGSMRTSLRVSLSPQWAQWVTACASLPQLTWTTLCRSLPAGGFHRSP